MPQATHTPLEQWLAQGQLSPLALLNTLLRRWRVVLGLPFVAGLVTGLLSLLIRPTYTATVAFVPETPSQGRMSSAILGLAGQFGISLGADAAQSPRFYAAVVRSRELMESVLLARYPDPERGAVGTDSATLLSILTAGGEAVVDSLGPGVTKLSQRVSTSVDNLTGIVRLTVETEYPELSAHVANHFITVLNEFNARTRQSQARERRRFAEQRAEEAEAALRAAEDELRSFYERNRSLGQSPQLRFEEDRLQRQVDIRRDLFLSLEREYETARIQEVNDTPVITVIDPAVPPQRRAKPRRRLMVVVAVVLAGMFGVFWAFAAAYAERVRHRNDAEYRDFLGIIHGLRPQLGPAGRVPPR